MFLFPKSIVYFFKNGYFTSLQNLVGSFPASNALKSNMAANAEFQDLAASSAPVGGHICLHLVL